jgi:hypothetical protein
LWDGRLGSLLAAARDSWAGAVALAAGFRRAGGTDLLASARRTSLAMAGVLDLKVLKKDRTCWLEALVKRTAEERVGQDKRCGQLAGARVGQMYASRGAPAAASRAEVRARPGSHVLAW